MTTQEHRQDEIRHNTRWTEVAALLLVSALCSGCLVVDDRDGRDRFDDRQQIDTYEEDRIIDDESFVDEEEED